MPWPYTGRETLEYPLKLNHQISSPVEGSYATTASLPRLTSCVRPSNSSNSGVQ